MGEVSLRLPLSYYPSNMELFTGQSLIDIIANPKNREESLRVFGDFIHENDDEVIMAIIELSQQKKSLIEIANIVGVSKSTIHRVLMGHI